MQIYINDLTHSCSHIRVAKEKREGERIVGHMVIAEKPFSKLFHRHMHKILNKSTSK